MNIQAMPKIDEEFERVLHDLPAEAKQAIFSLGNQVLPEMRDTIFSYGARIAEYHSRNHVQLHNIQRVLQKDFKNPAVKLAFAFHMSKFLFSYPEDLINYVIENEDEYYNDLLDFIASDEEGRRNPTLFTQFSQEAEKRLGLFDYGYAVSTNSFITRNLLISWLYGKDLSRTLKDVVDTGLTLEKIDDDVMPEHCKNKNFNEIPLSFCVSKLSIGLEEFVERAWKSEKSATYGEDSPELSKPSYLLPNPIDTLKRDDLSPYFESLFKWTAFEVIAYLRFAWSVHGGKFTSSSISENFFKLCNVRVIYSDPKSTEEWIKEDIPQYFGDKKNDEIEEIIASFSEHLPNAELNPISHSVLLYIAQNLASAERLDQIAESTNNAFFWLIFFSFQGVDLLGSGKVKPALQRNPEKINELRDPEVDFFNFDLAMIDPLIEWNEQCKEEGWELPISLFFNLNYDPNNNSMLKHTDNCKEWMLYQKRSFTKKKL